MMAKRFFYACAGLFVLALSYHLGAQTATAQGETGHVGRFQLFAGPYHYVDGVNTQVDREEGIFLLDTATGRVRKYSAGRLKNDTMYERWDDTVRTLSADK